MMDDNYTIYAVENDEQIERSVPVVRASFSTVARQFRLTEENAPTNAAFIKAPALYEMKTRGIEMFGLSDGTEQVGFVALEKASPEVCYIEKLAILPLYRHRGHGRRLMEHCFSRLAGTSIVTVSIGIINENTTLKKWYEGFGFRQTGTKRLSHLPFTVCFMAKAAENDADLGATPFSPPER